MGYDEFSPDWFECPNCPYATNNIDSYLVHRLAHANHPEALQIVEKNKQ